MTPDGGDEPAWLSRLAVEAIHRELIREHGGSFGLRDAGRLEAALARSRNRWSYGEDPDLAELAAAYAHAVAHAPPFVDGNKRVALMAAYVFLGINDRELDAPEPQAVAMVMALSTGDASEEGVAGWIREHLRQGADRKGGAEGSGRKKQQARCSAGRAPYAPYFTPGWRR